MIARLRIPHRRCGISSPPHHRKHVCAVSPSRSIAGADHRQVPMPVHYATCSFRYVSRRSSTRDDLANRSTALTMIPCPFRCPIRSHGTQSHALRDCPANCRRRPFPSRSSGWALTRFYCPLKSRLYGGAALVVTPHAPGVLIRYFPKFSRKQLEIYSRSMMQPPIPALDRA